MVVSVEKVSKRYGQIEALQSVSLAIGEGQILGLLGPNGAGKTTLIRLLTGSTRPLSGSVTVLGRDPKAARREIGYMPQAAALYEDLSARENLRFFGRAHFLTGLERKISELLDFSRLRSRENDPVYTFSGGMKQRVSLACALVHDPRVLLLDEPTAGVDPRLRAEFWSYFRDLARRGVTLLISTHQMDEALYCDRLAVLSEGEMLACETPRQLLARGRTRVKIWQGSEAQTETVDQYAEALPRLLRQSGLNPSITKIEIERDTLDDVLLRLIEERHA